MLVELGALAWPDAASLAERGTIALVPIGATEQHGPHLPLRMDTALTEAIVRAVAVEAVIPVVVMPVIPFGRSDHHMDFPGTISVSGPTLRSIVEAFVDALDRLSIRRVGLFSAHGGNFEFIGNLADELSNKSDVTVRAYSDLSRFLGVLNDTASSRGCPPPKFDLHAGLLETSLALHLGEQVDHKRYKELDPWTYDGDDLLDQIHKRGVSELSPSGVLGQPAGATADLGSHLLDALVQDVHTWLQHALLDRPWTPSKGSGLER